LILVLVAILNSMEWPLDFSAIDELLVNESTNAGDKNRSCLSL